LGGHRLLRHPVLRGAALSPIDRKRDGKLHAVRAIATVADDGQLHVRSAGGQASHLLRLMADANALALLPDGDGVETGASVDVLLLAIDQLGRTDVHLAEAAG
jgi:molybdopterin molybdotransferase